VLKHTEAWFPLKNPALVTMPLSFAAGIVVSLLRPQRSEAEGFARVERQMHVGTVEG
jgi:cation/acetate symporter